MSNLQAAIDFVKLDEDYRAKKKEFIALMWPAIRFAGLSNYYDEQDCVAITWEDEALVFDFRFDNDEEDITIPRDWITAEDLKSTITALRAKADADRAEIARAAAVKQLRLDASTYGYELTEKKQA